MGACAGKLSAEERAELEQSRKLDKLNKAAAQKENAKIKLLLLGAGESGKSTIFKQMKILYGKNHGFSDQEKEEMTGLVYSNILSNMKTVLENCESHTPAHNNNLLEDVLALDDATVIDDKVGMMLKEIWQDSGVQETWVHRASYQVQDSLDFYMQEIERVMADDFIPNNQDILRVRVRTSGIVEEEYVIQQVVFSMFDVGGQRNERKKWIHCFEGVTAVIFVAAISEYNQVLYEDNSMNRMEEALILFDEICNSKWFEETSMILFLNKEDLFVEKLPLIPFQVMEGPEARNQDFAGPHCVPGQPSSQPGTPEFERCVAAAENYLVEQFKAKNRYKKKEVYTKVTCATDTSNVHTVMDSCTDIILKINLRDNGFM